MDHCNSHSGRLVHSRRSGLQDAKQGHIEAKNLPLDGADFSRLKDGTYTGNYAGGMYKWRANDVEVTSSSGKVTDIKQLKSKDPAATRFDNAVLYKRVIDNQSLQVDTISSATLTSKAYLKAIEDALIKSGN